MRNFNGSLIVPKILKKRDSLGFLTFVLLQNIKKKLKGARFGDIKKNSKKSLSAEKSETLLLRNTCEKISAYPRVRTRNLWVEKQASYH